MKVDLHSHTYYSDGCFSSRELVEHAKENGVEVFALTDHDTCYGDDEIFEIAKEYGIYVIKGIEFSTRCNGEPIHIVGLCKGNKISDALREYSAAFSDVRVKRARKMMTDISNHYNVKINFDTLFVSKSVTRKNMLDNLKANNPDRPFPELKKMVGNHSPCYIPASELTVKEGLELLDSFGCIKILAHPCLIEKQETLDEIIGLGFDGIECYYPSMGDRSDYFKGLAKKYNLFISGGSDCHGDDDSSDHAMIGTSTINEEEFEVIRKRLGIEIK